MADVIRTKARRWGNSLGFVLPADARKELRLRPGQEVEITVKVTDNPLKELFGAFKDNKSTEELRAEMRRGFESKYDV